MSLRMFCLFLALFFSTLHLSYPVYSNAADLKIAMAHNRSGEELLARGKIPEAEQSFRVMLDNCGDNTFCRGIGTFYLGRCLLEAAKFEEAKVLFDDAESLFEHLNRKTERAIVLINKGKLEVAMGNYTLAMGYFDRAESDLQGEKNSQELFQVFNSKAVALTYLSKYDQAVELLDKAHKLSQVADKASNRATLETNRGLIYAKKQQNNDAMECFQSALDHYSEAKNLAAMVTVLNNIGHVQESASRYIQAIKKHQQALEISRSIGDEAGESLCLNNLGCTLLRTGDYGGAKAAFESSLEKRTRLGIKHFASETLNNLGLVRLSRAEYSAALADFEKAEQECSGVGSLSCTAWTLHNKAFLFKDMGRFKDSLASSTRAIELAHEIGDRRLEATATLRLGNLYEYEGWFDKATEEYVRAAELQQEIGDLFFKANTFADLANVLARDGDCDEAKVFFEKSLKLKREIGAPQVETLCKMALFMLERNRYCAKTSPESEKEKIDTIVYPSSPAACIEMAKALVTPDQGLDQMLVNYAEGRYLLETDPTSALKIFEGLYSTGESRGVSKFTFLAGVGEGIAFEKTGQLEKARDAFKKSVDYAEQIRESLDERARLKFMDGEEIFGIKHVFPYESLARVLMNLGMSEESLKISEYTTSRIFSESLARRNPDANADTPKEILEKDATLNNHLAGLLRELELSKLNACAETHGKLTTEIAKARNDLQTHISLLRQQYPLFAFTKYPEPTPLSSVGLTGSEMALIYNVTDSALLVYLLQGTKILKTSLKEVSRKELETMVRRFRHPVDVTPGKDTIPDKLRTFDLQTGKALSDILVHDFLPLMPIGAPLTIVPDDCLGTLSFEMLPLNDDGAIIDDGLFITVSGADFFGDRNDISYYQSLTALTLARALGKKQKPEKGLLVVADPVFHTMDARVINTEQVSRFAKQDEQFNTALMDAMETSSMGSFKLARLPLTGELAESLADVFEQDASLFIGLDASKDNVLKNVRPELHQYSSLVFATHGYFSPDNPVFQEPILFLSMVPLGTDGFLRMSEVMGLNLNSDIVALTACQTGLGKHITGEGTMGMGRAFQYAGAKSALMTLWSVSERASVKLVENFFQNMRSGMSRRDALKKAKAKIRSEGFDHPFYWAAFILFGETS